MLQINSQLASAAVYRSLCEVDCNIQSVICSFILLQYLEWGQLQFTAAQMSQRLYEESQFNIPQSVIREALLNFGRDYFIYDKRNKTFERSLTLSEDIINELNKLLTVIREQNSEVISNIAQYIAIKKNINADAINIEDVGRSLSLYLRGHEEVEYSEIIAEYLIQCDKDSSTIKQIQSIKEGNIFLEGLSQEIITDNIKDNFNIPLTLYLETEILFHIVGLNGSDYAQIGNDFIALIKEINDKSHKSKPIIKLKYFPETAEEISRYFEAAKDVVAKSTIHPRSGIAMKNIVSQCKYKYEVERLKNKVFDDLASLGITVDSDTNYRPYTEQLMKFNLEGSDELERLQNAFEEKWSSDEIENSLILLSNN